MPCLVLVAEMKRLRTFRCPPAEEAVEVAKICGLLKVHTRSEILLDGLHGKELFAGRGNLEEKCSGATKLAPRMLPEHPRDEQGCLQTTLFRTQTSNTLEQCGNHIHPHTFFSSGAACA